MKTTAPIAVLLLAGLWLMSCGGGDTAPKSSDGEVKKPKSMLAPSYDPNRGLGKYDDSNLALGALDAGMAKKGEAISGSKCLSCHKLSDERLVGPGWKGVTERRTGPWLMNFITNPDPMIDQDPELQAQLELCLVRMPNQSLTDDDARNVLEYMRQVDGVK